MKKTIAIFILLALAAAISSANTIVLKSGERIVTQGTWEEDGVIKYFKDGAISKGIPKEKVERIETGEHLERSSYPTEKPLTPVTNVIDLDKKLLEKAPPKNPIERAGNATVTIKGSIGSGSGFFITQNGHILTNKHVLQGDEKKLKKIEKNLEKGREIIKTAERSLRGERKNIEQLEKQISTDNRYNNPHNLSVLKDAKKRYRSRVQIYKKHKKALKENERELRKVKTKRLVQRSVTITLIDQTELKAVIVRISKKRDLALLRLAGYKTPFILPENVQHVGQGDKLYAIGNPLNFSHSVSAGVFSGHQRGMLMTSAPINAGNSGGPLVTREGKVVGINTMKMVGEGVEGIGFAIPIHVAVQEFKKILGPHL